MIQTLETRPAKPAVFAEIKGDLREMLLAEKIKQAAPGYLRELRGAAELKRP